MIMMRNFLAGSLLSQISILKDLGLSLS